METRRALRSLKQQTCVPLGGTRKTAEHQKKRKRGRIKKQPVRYDRLCNFLGFFSRVQYSLVNYTELGRWRPRTPFRKENSFCRATHFQKRLIFYQFTIFPGSQYKSSKKKERTPGHIGSNSMVRAVWLNTSPRRRPRVVSRYEEILAKIAFSTENLLRLTLCSVTECTVLFECVWVHTSTTLAKKKNGHLDYA